MATVDQDQAVQNVQLDLRSSLSAMLLTILRKKPVENRKPAFSSFPTMFSTLYKKVTIILATFNLLIANALNLVQSKNGHLVKS